MEYDYLGISERRYSSGRGGAVLGKSVGPAWLQLLLLGIL